MKMKKMIALLLSFVMVLGMFPMMASAASENLIDAIATVLGNETAVVATSSIFGVANLDFTAEDIASTEGLTVEGGVAFDGVNGAVFPAEAVPAVEGENTEGDSESGEETEDPIVVPTLKYTGVAGNDSSVSDGWGALAASGNVAFGFKLNEPGSLTIETEDLYRGGKAHLVVSPTEVVVYESNVDFLTGEEGEANNAIREQLTVTNTNTYAPGTEWNDVLIVKNEATAGGGYKVYMKKETDAKFTLVAEATYFAPNGSWKNGSLRFSGYDAAVSYAASYVGTLKPIETIAQIMKSEDASNWPYSKAYTGTTKPEEATVTGEVNYTADGIVFPAAAAATVKIQPDSDHWSNVNTTVLKGKFSVGNATEKMFILANTPNASGRHYLTLYPTYLTTNTSGGRADFNFGTDWFELAVYSYEGGHDIYVKNATTNGKWKFLITNTNRSGSATYFSIQSYATNTGTFTLQGLDIYKADKTYDTVGEIMGGDVVSSYAFDFNDDFDATIMTNSSASMTTGLDCTDQYGIDLNDGAWNFNAYKTKNWSPLNGNLPGETYIPQALYFNMKFNTIGAESTLTGGTPSVDGRLYRGLKAGSALNLNGATGTVTAAIALDTNWTEHLIVPAATETGGYSHYIKSPTLTNDKWIKVVETTNYRDAGNERTGIGVNFSQTDACIKSLRTYQLATKEEDAKPQNATLLYYNEEFNTEPTYANLTVANGNYETEGVVSFPAADSSTYGKYTLNYAGIPVGGYAEFKTSSNGAIIANFADEEKTVTWNIFKPYTGMEGSSDSYLFGDSNNLARIFRVIRTADGYTMYTKSDSDLGWQKVCENAGFAAADSTIPKITFVFRNHSDGASVGSGLLDYMKIYGPAKADKLIVTDGYGTKEFKNGDTIGYGSALRPIVNAEAGKLMVANYKKNQLTKLTVLDVSELTVDKLISVVQGGTDTVKVFLWNGLDGKMENADDVLTLNFPTMNN